MSAITFGARVYDAGTGALLRAYPFTPPGSYAPFINDVAVTRDAAFFTDSCSPTLFKVPLGPGGRLPDPSAVEALALTGDFEFVAIPYPGGAYPCYPNMNGIVATDNGRWLAGEGGAESAAGELAPPTSGVFLHQRRALTLSRSARRSSLPRLDAGGGPTRAAKRGERRIPRARSRPPTRGAQGCAQ